MTTRNAYPSADRIHVSANALERHMSHARELRASYLRQWFSNLHRRVPRTRWFHARGSV